MTQKVNEPTPIVQKMMIDWALVDDLLGGTRAMRLAREKYLPKRNLEDPADYDARLSTSTLLPVFGETVAKLTGRVFAEAMVINDDVPEWLAGTEEDRSTGLLDDIDMQGNNVHVFARSMFADALAHGLTHVLIEAPPTVARTQADEQAAGLRPYAIPITADRVLGWKQNEAGELTQVRIKFWREAADGEFGTELVEQVKVYEPGRVRTFEASKEDPKAEWVQTEDVPTGLDVIPLITYYTKRTGYMEAEPPLRELAFLNSKHWMHQSSHDALLETASVPILAVFGAVLDKTIAIGAKMAVSLPQDAKMEYVEHTGAALNSGREALNGLKEDMREAGAKLLQPGTGSGMYAGAKTATQTSEEAASENSALGTMVRDFKDAWTQILSMFATYRSEETGGSVEPQPNLDPDLEPVSSLTFLLSMCNSGKLSDETLFSEVQKRGMVAEDLSWEEEAARIKNQPSAARPLTVAAKPSPFGRPAPAPAKSAATT